MFNKTWDQLQFSFRLGKLAVELYDRTATPASQGSVSATPSLKLCIQNSVLS